MPIYVYCTDSAYGYYNLGVFCLVQQPRSGTTGYANTIPLEMMPTDYSSSTYHNNVLSAYSAAVGLVLSTGGVAKTNGTDVPKGLYSYDLAITATSGYAFGCTSYIDPLTGYFYSGPFVVLSLLTTTARGTVTSANMWYQFGGIGSGIYYYWVLKFDQVRNDASVSTDGTTHVYFDLDDQVGASNCFGIDIYIGQRPSYIQSASFGYTQQADNLDLIHFTT